MRYWIPALITAILIFFISHQPHLPEVPGGPPDWLMHFLTYGFFALTCAYGATRGFDAALRTPARLSTAFAIATLYGISDEWHQSFVGRDATVQDWLADAIGAALMAACLWLWWRWSEGPESTK